MPLKKIISMGGGGGEEAAKDVILQLFCVSLPKSFSTLGKKPA